MDLQIIRSKIFEVRGYRVMLDYHLAELYGVQTKVLKQAVKRNEKRFPSDFRFTMTKDEWDELVTNCDQLPDSLKHSYVLPDCFTEQGVAMLSSMLNSDVAIEININIMRAFNAMYSPDSLVVKAKLDEEEDAYQIEHKIPWQSNEMDGVEGTLPIYFQIRGINGGQPEIMNQFSIKPTGVIELPYNHTVPSGRYIIDVKVGNRDHGYTIDSAFTVIIK